MILHLGLILLVWTLEERIKWFSPGMAQRFTGPVANGMVSSSAYYLE